MSDATLLIFSGQDETLITRRTLSSLDLRTATWSSVPLPTDTPPHPSPRIDGAAAAVRGVGLVVFGGVGEDFGFVPPADAWLLRGGEDVRPPRRLALPSKAQAAGGAGGAPDGPLPVGPPARACLGLCADGLTLHCFGGFDGEADLNDLWSLNLHPPRPGGEQRGRFDASLFKVRQAAASKVLHATPCAYGNNSITPHIHVLVGLAARDAARADGTLEGDADRWGPASRVVKSLCGVGDAPDADRGALPVVSPTPPTTSDLASGSGDGLSCDQQAAVIALSGTVRDILKNR